jgi:signal transduction histidine kinase/CheY-like chemotaxis protein/CHASE3 domain sensor protein
MPHRRPLATPDDATHHAAPARSRAWLPTVVWGGFVVAAAAVLLIALVSTFSLQLRQQAAERMSQARASLTELQLLLSALKDAETGQRGFLLTGEDVYLEPYRNAQSALAERLVRLRGLLGTDALLQDRLAEVARQIDVKQAELQRTIDLHRAGRASEALAIVRGETGKRSMDRLRELLGDLAADQEALLADRRQAWEDASSRSLRVSVGGSAVLLALLAIGLLVVARAHRAREDEAWLRAAQAALARRLQGDQRLEQLCERALAFLAEALKARVGALYVAEPDGVLRRMAGYALAVGGAPDTVLPGEGLLGQAARADEPVCIADLDSAHLPISSATGRSAHRALVLAPARHDGQLQAVVELGLLHPVDDTALALLARVSSLLAIAVRSARDRSRLEALLEETQRQAEELQAQQEELRVSNDELDAQGRALRDSQAELELQRAELEQRNTQLAQHASTLEQQQQALLQTQAELQHQSQALATASRYKSEFLANMSHELRTPLNSALILSQLLVENKGGGLGPEQVRFAQAIHDANNDLLLLINDVLDLAKIEAGHVELQAETVRLADVAQRLRTLFEPLAHNKGLRLGVTVSPQAPPTLTTDGQRLQQVLKNLVANALKFTERGEVQVTLSPASSHEGGVRIDVRDTGLGIAADKHALIFEAFRQADGSTSRQFGGTGLGLSISRELVLRLGGQILLDSAPGQGSTFSVLLPAVLPTPADAPTAPTRAGVLPARPTVSASPSTMPSTSTAPATAEPAAVPPLPPSPRTSGRRMLLAVEDDGRFADVLRRLVEEQGFDCVTVGTGAGALLAAREQRPDGILLDVGLPDQSGLEVLERLKRDPATRHIPVHLVSAQDRSPAAMALGAVGHLVKPANRAQLVDAIRLLEHTLDQPLRRVLVVEDDPVLRDSLHRLLSAPAVDIHSVGTVADALAALRSTTFDCMVTDLALPDGSGFDLLAQMAESEAFGFPPVIVYTGRALSRDEELRLRRLSRSIIVKGARSPERLLDEVTLFLHSVEAQLAPAQRQLLGDARSRDSALDGRTILLAEDDVRNIFALASVFEPHGVRLEIARNGQEALDKLASMPAIDLVLMDVMMPEMDGLEALRRIRAQPALAELPVIALTAKAMADDRAHCLAAGANDYLAKPIDVDRLLSLCRVWMPA